MAGPRGGTGSPAGMGGGPGPRDPAWSSGQAQTCAQLLTQVAPECSVPKEPFVLSCQADMAECAPQGRRDCACASLSEYSRRCSMAGQPVSHWRRPGLCCESWGRQRGGPGTLPGSWKETGEGAGQGAGAPPPPPGALSQSPCVPTAVGPCPANQVYQECGAACARTCSNPQHTCSSFCTFGCFCPEGQGNRSPGTPRNSPRDRGEAPTQLQHESARPDSPQGREGPAAGQRWVALEGVGLDPTRGSVWVWAQWLGGVKLQGQGLLGGHQATGPGNLCPTGTVLDDVSKNHTCVPVAQCPCVLHGVAHAPGEVVTAACRTW